MFSLAVGGPHRGHFWSFGVFFRILDCSELRYCYLNMTVTPPECMVAGTVVPVPVFPGVLPRPSSQEIPVELEDHTWVCDRTREEVLRGAKLSTKKTSSQRISCIHKVGLMVHVRGACAQQLPMFARVTARLLQLYQNVKAHAETITNWNLQYK